MTLRSWQAHALRHRSALLMGTVAGGGIGLLISLAWLGLSWETDPEVPEAAQLMALAEARRSTGAGGIPDAVQWLREALVLEPENEQAASGLGKARSDAAQAVRDELRAGRPMVAVGLLDIFDAEWPGDPDLRDLREETGKSFDELARAGRLADILDRAEADIAEKRLRAPKENNAWDKLMEAAELIEEGDRGRMNWIEALRRQIASDYIELVDLAIAQGSLANARRHLVNLEATTSNHPDATRLRQQVARLEEARAARATAERAASDPASDPAVPAEPSGPGNSGRPSPARPRESVLADVPEGSALLDQEDEFWAKVRRQYETTADCAILQRYNEEYPGGRFESEYFALKAQCARRGNL